jgi:CheY-like chemotaxis protein
VQQPQALDRSKGGLGIGLAIVRSLTELHGGRVRAKSVGLGQGSEFIVELPPAAEDTRARRIPECTAAPAVAAQRGISKRVLVVDDNVDAAKGIAELLSTLGHEACVAYDGPSALGVAQAFKPNVCLLDIELPVMDGYELARRLREIAGLPADMRMVAVTGYGRETDHRRTTEGGFSAHLVKPVPVDVLASAVGQ